MLEFRIPWVLWIVLMPLPLSMVVLFSAANSSLPGPFLALALAPVALTAVFIIVFSLFISTLRVGPRGLVLYRVNRLTWDEVTSARLRRVFRLPYLELTRKKGMRWWIPLYFRGPVELRDALRQSAPEGHPIRAALA